MDDDNELIVLFVKMVEGTELTDQLKSTIKVTLRQRVSPRHVPNHIHPIDDIPYTNSGKKVELAVKQVINCEVVSFCGFWSKTKLTDYFFVDNINQRTFK